MARTRRTFTEAQKREILKRVKADIESGTPKTEAYKAADIAESVFHRWDRQLKEGKPARRVAAKVSKKAREKKYKPNVFTWDGEVVPRQKFMGLRGIEERKKLARYDQLTEENVYLRKRLGEILVENELLAKA